VNLCGRVKSKNFASVVENLSNLTRVVDPDPDPDPDPVSDPA